MSDFRPARRRVPVSVGESVRIDGVEYMVIGTIERKGQILGGSNDNFVVIPIPTFMKVYGDRGGDVQFRQDVEAVLGGIARQTRATPGVYASERSRCVRHGLEVTTSSLPGRGFSWYS